MGSIWRLVRPLRHPVRPLRHQYSHYGTYGTAINGRAVDPEHNRTYCSYCCVTYTPRVTGTSPIPIKTARPVVSTEPKTMQSTTLPYMALPDPAPAMPYTAMLSMALPYSAMPSVMSARPCPMGYYGQGNQFPLMPNPNWMSEREQLLQHQLLQELQ